MGCGNSAFDAYANNPDNKDTMRQFQAMQFSNGEVRKLFNIYRAVDVDGSGSIALSELLAHIHLDRTPFTEKIFSIFDDDHSGEIDFKEFVMSLWNYCTLTKNTLDMFAFDLYDKDGSGELSPNEVSKMVQDIYGKNEAKNNFHAKSIINELTALDTAGKVLNIDQFTAFVKNHQALLFPAFQMQSALRRNILGSGFWESHANKRIRFSNGKYVSVGQFIVAHLAGNKASPLTQMHAGDNKIYAVHDDVHDLVEAAGSKAARKKSVARNQTRQSFADAKGIPTENVLSLVNANPNSLTESAKVRVTSSLMSIGILKQRQSAVAPAPAGASYGLSDSSPASGSPNLSHVNSAVLPASVPPSSKILSNQNGVTFNASSGNMSSPFVSPRDRDPGKREANRRYSREDALAGTTLTNPTLTTSTMNKIEKASAIEAWQNQPSLSHTSSTAATALTRKSTGMSPFSSGHDLRAGLGGQKEHSPDVKKRRGSFGGGEPIVGTPAGPGLVPSSVLDTAINGTSSSAAAAAHRANDAKKRRSSFG